LSKAVLPPYCHSLSVVNVHNVNQDDDKNETVAPVNTLPVQLFRVHQIVIGNTNPSACTNEAPITVNNKLVTTYFINF
jgi:hypothetical protein